MKHEVKGPGAYVETVRQNTQRYFEDLLAENEKLRRLSAGLEDEIAALKRTAARSEDAVQVLHEELRNEQQEHAALRRRLEEIEGENRTFSERYVHVEQQNTDLANLYVATYRLHATLDRHEVLDAIQEIIINLLGCEELAVFELDPEAAELRLAASFGVDTDTYRQLAVGEGLIGDVAKSGEAYYAETSDDAGSMPLDEHLTACIPLKVEDRVTGAISIFRLLPQKEDGLGALDHELLDLLSAQAGAALYCSALHTRSESKTAP